MREKIRELMSNEKIVKIVKTIIAFISVLILVVSLVIDGQILQKEVFKKTRVIAPTKSVPTATSSAEVIKTTVDTKITEMETRLKNLRQELDSEDISLPSLSFPAVEEPIGFQ